MNQMTAHNRRAAGFGILSRYRSVAGLGVLLLVFCAPQLAAIDTVAEPYSARYAVYRNGKLQARAEFMLQQQGDDWVMKSDSIGTHGMARFLKFRDYEYVEGQFDGPQFRPLHYLHELQWLGPDQNSAAEFDWQNNTVTVTDDGETNTLELVPGALDPMSLQLELRRRLATEGAELEFKLVDVDEIEDHEFRKLSPERLETSLGCLLTQPVEKVREHSTRYTRSWHATEFGYIPVRMEHGKTDGDQMELRITELVLDGSPVEPKPACAAAQSERARSDSK